MSETHNSPPESSNPFLNSDATNMHGTTNFKELGPRQIAGLLAAFERPEKTSFHEARFGEYRDWAAEAFDVLAADDPSLALDVLSTLLGRHEDESRCLTGIKYLARATIIALGNADDLKSYWGYAMLNSSTEKTQASAQTELRERALPALAEINDDRAAALHDRLAARLSEIESWSGGNSYDGVGGDGVNV